MLLLLLLLLLLLCHALGRERQIKATVRYRYGHDKFQRHLSLRVEMSLGLWVFKGCRLLRTLQIEWEIVQKSVSVVTIKIREDLTH